MFAYLLLFISIIACVYVIYEMYRGINNPMVLIVYIIHIILTIALFINIVLTNICI